MIAESQFEEILAALISPGFHVCKGVISAEEAASLQALTATGPSGSALFTNGAIWYHCKPNGTHQTRVGLLGMCNRSVLLPQEDMPRQLSDEQLEGKRDRLKQLLGRNVAYRDPAQGAEWRPTDAGFRET
jgi:hypothetical protein